MSSVELRREGAVAFTVPLSRALFRDARLTFGARGLFAFLWDLPEGWVLRLAHLVKMGPERRDALRSRLRELEKVGAIRIEAIRADGGRVAGKRWVLIAADRWAIEASLAQEPLQGGGSTEERVFQSSVKPIIGKPDAKVLQGVKVMQGEVAAPRTRGDDSATATAPKSHKRRVKRASGIVTWTNADLPGAERIEQEHKHDYIMRLGRFAERHDGELAFGESGNMPSWSADDPRKFWVETDARERANGTLYHEVEFALPRELTLDQQISAAREAHHFAGAGYVAKFGGQIQQADLVFDDILLNTTHGVTPLRLCALVDKDSHLYQTG